MNTPSSSNSGVPRASLAGFVSTSVLTSSDGLFGDNVEEKRVTEAPAPRAEDTASYKPLYDHLQERKSQKDSEWKEKNNPFAPPKGLDDEEFEYIEDLESRKEELGRKRLAQHEEDLAQFLVARGTPKAATSAPLTVQHLRKYPTKEDLKTTNKKKIATVVVKAKRKAKDTTRKDGPKTVESSEVSEGQPSKKRRTVENSNKSVEAGTEKPHAAALGLVSYSSDSDVHSDDDAKATSNC